MKPNRYPILLLLFCLLSGLAGCKKDYFEQATYDKLVQASFPVKEIDGDQDWRTIKRATLRLALQLMPSETYEVYVYDRDPFAGDERLSLLWQGTSTGGRSLTVNTEYLPGQGQVFVGVRDWLHYMSLFQVPVTGGYGSATLSFDNATLFRQVESLPECSPLSYRYLFENSFPRTGDFDFNDVVLTVTPFIDSLTVRLRVSLDAVGALEPMGAALRIVGLKASDILSCEREGNFDEGFPFALDTRLRTVKTEEVLIPNSMKYGTTDVVVNLFSNAHWAMARKLADDGSILAKYFNTKTRDSEDEDYQNDMPAAIVTYTFRLASETAVNRFRADYLDAFILEEYNGGFWEVHTVPYKTDEVIRSYASGNKRPYASNVPWALCVPGYVSYPYEKHPISTTVSIGVSTYQRFPAWAANRYQSADWYDYPTKEMVYQGQGIGF